MEINERENGREQRMGNKVLNCEGKEDIPYFH